MSNSIQLGFVSILLSLVMFFAFLSFKQDELGLEVDLSTKCRASCCLSRCETHKVEVLDSHHVRFSGEVYSPEAFGHHLVQVHKDCEIAIVHVLATPELEHDIVLHATQRVLEVAPHSEISWGRMKDK